MFKFSPTDILDVIVVEPDVFGDDRGFFMETYSEKFFKQNGISSDFVQDNHSKSKKWVFRGFHFQTQKTQGKLVRVTAGAVLDFAIDLRKSSPTYGKYIVEELSAKNKKQLYIPRGFGHGFLTLEDDTEFVYKCDDYYAPEYDGGILYSDPDINIDFEAIKEKYDISEISLSENDRNRVTLREFYDDNPF